MSMPFDFEQWRLQDRCQYCFTVFGLTVDDLEMAGEHVAWTCQECKKQNVLIGPAKADRIPIHIRTYVKVGKPVKAPHFEPVKLPWYKKLFR
jgi:hypothetical protein